MDYWISGQSGFAEVLAAEHKAYDFLANNIRLQCNAGNSMQIRLYVFDVMGNTNLLVNIQLLYLWWIIMETKPISL